jgi:hypothetical protein
MPNSYRIRTDLGINKSINVSIDQEFEYLEILSLKVLQSEIYTRVCSDYGVIIGRVSVNNGFGLPNAKVSVFIPLTEEDGLNSVISEIYPYQSISDVNEDGYRYNLLPYEPSYSNHVPTGTFFNRTDVLTNPTLIQVYDKYFKYNAVTNDSGDFMIFGVPVGTHTISIDVDLSDIGEFSLSPQDLIRMGIATQAQVNGTKFKKSTNLRELPQIINLVRTVVVEPLWGQSEVCNLGICRSDFDLSNESNININPTSIFMGSLVSNIDSATVRTSCNSKWKLGGLCNLTVSPGEILAIRQTIKEDPMGRPTLELFDLEMGGVVIDDNGAWLLDVPMNLDYLITNEFGEQVISDDPNKGIPTKGKYRFKVKWAQSPSLGESIRRGYYLVPNIKEYGWNSTGNDPTKNSGIGTQYAFKSYAFSLDWDDYGDTTPMGQHMIQEAINCEDRFYLMQYNKVYTVSQMIDKFRGGLFPDNFVGIKAISQDDCNTENNKFPTNDANFRFDIIYTLFNLLSVVIRSVVWILIIILHVLYTAVYILWFYLLYMATSYAVSAVLEVINAFGTYPPNLAMLGSAAKYAAISAALFIVANQWKKKVVDSCTPMQLPLILYPDCSMCDCSLQQGGVDGSAVTADVTADVGVEDESQEHNGNCIGTGSVQLVKLSKGETYDKTLIGGSDDYYIQTVALLTGDVIPPQTNPKPVQNNVKINAPQFFRYGSNPYNNFTTSLTFSERMNLFNTKAKYFDESISGFPNPGGGVNRVKVNFNPNNTDHHFDNVVAVLCSKQSLSRLLPGTLITFQNPKLTGDTRASADINVDMYLSNVNAVQNQFQNFAITGTTLPLTSFTVNYAHISGSGNTTTNYSGLTITASTDYHKFPIDIEYFQVLTGMTYSAYTNQCVTQLPNSFNARYLSNKVRVNHLQDNYCNYPYTNPETPLYINPISKIKNYNDLVVVFLVRGVDPYSPKVNVKYGLGRLFGHTNEDAVQIGGTLSGDPKFHLNIPIQGGFKNTRQDMPTNTTLDTYATLNQNLYYNSYTYKPDPSLFKPFSSSLPRLYSSLDNLSMAFNGGGCGPYNLNVDSGSYQSTSGLRIDGDDNDYSNEWGKSKKVLLPVSPILGCDYFDYTNNNITGTTSNDIPLAPSYTGVTRGYFPDEIIEGGGILIMDTNKNDIRIPYRPHNNSVLVPPTTTFDLSYDFEVTSLYLSPSYNENVKMLFGLGTSGRQIIMRSDRLPTSTCVQWNKCNGLTDSTFSFPLFANENFFMDTMDSKGGVFAIGLSSGSNPVSTGAGGNATIETASYSSSVGSALIQSFTCPQSVNLDCYIPQGDTIMVSRGRCSYNFWGQSIFRGGCYLVGTVPFFSLVGDLFSVQPEWQSRLNINFAACRNTWSDSFANNWINGTLFAFPFKTSTYYDSNNRAQSDHCKEPIIFHSQTKTFYYRSSPYKFSTNEFIGSDRPNPGGIVGFLFGSYFVENTLNLKYPTTMMDLGPRTYYLQEIVMSDIYDGYVMDKLAPTTFSDVSDILNLHIISRMINKSFLDSLISIVIGENIIGKYFGVRPNLKSDADYPQMIGISSELGVAEFDTANYPDPPSGSQPPIYFNGASSSSAIIGIFFSSNTQVRDFITPKRTIIDDTVNMSNVCAFNNFGVYSQVVPFYKWYIDPNGPGRSGTHSIFGDQGDNWVTGPVNGPAFFSNQYQSLDRLQVNSDYFMGAQAGQPVKNFKGYIYAVDANGIINPKVQYWTNPNTVTVGAPFHFFFGLKKGKSSYDRFTQKWINTENIVN